MVRQWHTVFEAIAGERLYGYLFREGTRDASVDVREPAMRMSTRRRALGSQPGSAVVWKTPMSARTKSSGLVSARRAPLVIAFLTSTVKAVWIRFREPSIILAEPPATVSIAGT